MSDQSRSIEEVFDEIQALKDLFLRRLVDDKVKVSTISRLSEENERLVQIINDMHFISFIKELILICDRIEANQDADDFDLSIRDELLEVFCRRGVMPITETQQFNPSIHNAVGTVPAHEGIQSGTIAYVQRTGYYQGDKVLRPADVIVVTDH